MDWRRFQLGLISPMTRVRLPPPLLDGFSLEFLLPQRRDCGMSLYAVLGNHVNLRFVYRYKTVTWDNLLESCKSDPLVGKQDILRNGSVAQRQSVCLLSKGSGFRHSPLPRKVAGKVCRRYQPAMKSATMGLSYQWLVRRTVNPVILVRVQANPHFHCPWNLVVRI